MIRSFVRKIFFALLWLWVISLLAFWLSKNVPGDEILDYLSIEQGDYNQSVDPATQRETYARVAQKRGLDLPFFYFSLQPGYIPDEFYHIQPVTDRNVVRAWMDKSGDGKTSIALYNGLRNALTQACHSHQPGMNLVCGNIHQLLGEDDPTQLHQKLSAFSNAEQQNGNADPYPSLLGLANSLSQKKNYTVSDFIPAFKWHGPKNQYHRWITGLIAFKPLTSLIDGRNAWTKILEALRWTLLFNGLAFILAISIGSVIGIWSGRHPHQFMTRVVTIVLFILFAIPAFWLATLLIYGFASGEWLSVFPTGGLGRTSSGNVFAQPGSLLMHMILPVTCMTAGSLAYISRQVKQSVVHEYQQPYVDALRSIGIPEKSILKKHIVRNALFPLITLMGQSLPVLVSGSLIIEVIFSIPGMGRLMYTSLLARDWPVVFPVLMLGAAVTIGAYIVTDVLYKWIDPRVKSLA